MRRLLTVLLLCAAALGVRAADNATFPLSKTLFAVRIANFAQQVTVFSPLIQQVDGVLKAARERQPAASGQKSATEGMQDVITYLKGVPGLKADGDIWVAVMPPPPGATLTPKKDAPADPATQPPTYLILPLTDPAAFATFLATPPADGKPAPVGKVCGKYGVVAMSGPKPTMTDVLLDLPLLSKDGIVISVQMANMKQDFAQAGMPQIFTQMLAPLSSIMTEQLQNVQRVEVGLTMDGNDLLAESYVVPTTTGALAKTLAAPETGADLALEYAGYLPANIAYCSASGPMLKGEPGAGYALTHAGFGILGQFMAADDAAALTAGLGKLTAQSCQGRAIGIAAPATGKGGATLLAVYHVTGAAEARAGVRTFATAFAKSTGSIMGGMLADAFAWTVKPDAETLAGQPVDLVSLTVKTPPAQGDAANNGAAPPPMKPITIDCRVAYVGDKMLLTMGTDSKQALVGMLTRLHDHTAGFTGTPRFLALKNTLPAKIHGFDLCATQDLLNVMVGLIPDETGKKEAQTFLNKFPAQTTLISNYQELKAGNIHSVLRLPDEQLRYLTSLINTAIQMAPVQPAQPAKQI